MPRFKALTTTIAGRRYRSQLEAKWATFFGLVGWPFEYEPFQLPGWIPDFLLLGETPVVVEVKPVYLIPGEVVEKIERARPPHDVLILGCTLPVRSLTGREMLSPFILGWLGERSGDDDHTHLWWGDAVLGRTAGGAWGFSHREGSQVDRIGGTGLDLPSSRASVAELWAEAGNKTQWGLP